MDITCAAVPLCVCHCVMVRTKDLKVLNQANDWLQRAMNRIVHVCDVMEYGR